MGVFNFQNNYNNSHIYVVPFVVVYFFPEGLINFIHKDRQRAEKMKREARKRLAQFNMQRREKLKNNPDSQKEKKN